MHEPVEISLNSPNDIPMPHKDVLCLLWLELGVGKVSPALQIFFLNLFTISFVDNLFTVSPIFLEALILDNNQGKVYGGEKAMGLNLFTRMKHAMTNPLVSAFTLFSMDRLLSFRDSFKWQGWI